MKKIAVLTVLLSLGLGAQAFAICGKAEINEKVQKVGAQFQALAQKDNAQFKTMFNDYQTDMSALLITSLDRPGSITRDGLDTVGADDRMSVCTTLDRWLDKTK